MTSGRPDLLRSTFADDALPDPGRSSELLALAQRGDPAALNDLLIRYQDRIRRIVRVQLGPRLRSVVDTMDMVQETLQHASSALLDGPGLRHENLLPWLSRIALNRIRDANDHHYAARRDRGRDQPLAAPAAADTRSPLQLSASQTRVEDRAYKNEVRDLLDEAVSGLSEEHRQVILLRDYCGRDWESIAREMERPSVPATKQLHQRAWIRVRRAVWPRLRDRR